MTSKLFSLDGKVALVTGANTGLGQAMAIALANAGARIALVGRSVPGETEALIRANGGRTTAVMADLRDANVAVDVMSQAENALGPVDILVNNAGIIRRKDALDFGEEDWDDVMATNLKVPFFLAQATARSMLSGGRAGKIINVASLLSLQGGDKSGIVYSEQERPCRAHSTFGQRMGCERHQCECHRSRILRHE